MWWVVILYCVIILFQLPQAEISPDNGTGEEEDILHAGMGGCASVCHFLCNCSPWKHQCMYWYRSDLVGVSLELYYCRDATLSGLLIVMPWAHSIA